MQLFECADLFAVIHAHNRQPRSAGDFELTLSYLRNRVHGGVGA